MFNICGALFSSNKGVVALYGDIITLNNEVVAGRTRLSFDDISHSQEPSKRFLFEFIEKNGELYSMVIELERKNNRTAKHICVLAGGLQSHVEMPVLKSSETNTAYST
jgi:hypothetical protein